MTTPLKVRLMNPFLGTIFGKHDLGAVFWARLRHHISMYDRRKSTSFAPVPSFASDATYATKICFLSALVFEKASNNLKFFEVEFEEFLGRFVE